MLTRSSGRARYSSFLKQWRAYSVLLSAVLVFGLVAMSIDTFIRNPDAKANDINYEDLTVGEWWLKLQGVSASLAGFKCVIV